MKIAVLEDDEWFASLLEFHISANPDHSVELYSSSKDFFKKCKQRPDALTLDFSLPDEDGTSVLEKAQKKWPGLPVIVISGQKDIMTAIDLLKKGAHDYLVKDEDLQDRLWASLKTISEISALKEEVQTLKSQIKARDSGNQLIIGNSPSIQRLREMIHKAASTNITVSIHGETGTGKELVAKSVHEFSERATHAFVPVNVAAIPENLLESELFGHEKGAFTGAVGQRIGRFEEANKGTLFLDEVAEMPTDMQAKLLRVLQEREIFRLGSNKPIKIDVKLVVATHKDLSLEVEEGRFRQDLYYRLLGVPLEVPALRDRGHDVVLLSKHFIKQFCKANKLKEKDLSEQAEQTLLEYAFPGNVRELRSIIELACIMSSSDVIQKMDLKFPKLNTMGQLMAKEMSLAEYNERIIDYYLEKYDGNVLQVAEVLDIGKSTIYRKLNERKDSQK